MALQFFTMVYNSIQHCKTSYNSVQLRTMVYNSVQRFKTSYNSVQLRTTELNITHCGWAVIVSDQNKSDRTFMKFNRSMIRGIALTDDGEATVLLCSHLPQIKTIFNTIRQYSQNKLFTLFFFKLKCIVTY